MTAATPHRLVNPPELAPAVGFAHAVDVAPGRWVVLGGETGHRRNGTLPDGLVAQLDQALANVVTALAACDAGPEHLVHTLIYVTDVAAYRAQLPQLGEAWRRHLGRHYPATALLGVTELFDPAAEIEIVATAVVPD